MEPQSITDITEKKGKKAKKGKADHAITVTLPDDYTAAAKTIAAKLKFVTETDVRGMIRDAAQAHLATLADAPEIVDEEINRRMKAIHGA